MNKSIIFALMLLIGTSCDRFSKGYKTTDGQERIICIAKQYTEIVFALNAQQNIVGVDVSSTYPVGAKKLPTVGYHRA